MVAGAGVATHCRLRSGAGFTSRDTCGDVAAESHVRAAEMVEENVHDAKRPKSQPRKVFRDFSTSLSSRSFCMIGSLQSGTV